VRAFTSMGVPAKPARCSRPEREEPRVDGRTGVLCEDRDADIDGRAVERRHVHGLRADLVHRWRSGWLPNGATDSGTCRRGSSLARITELGATERPERRVGELRSIDQEEVRDAPGHVAFAQDDEAVVSPAVALAPACATTASRPPPLGGTTRGSSERRRGPGRRRLRARPGPARSPEPKPASVRRRSRPRLAAPCRTFRPSKESETGSVKSSGLLASGRATRAAPLERHRRPLALCAPCRPGRTGRRDERRLQPATVSTNDAAGAGAPRHLRHAASPSTSRRRLRSATDRPAGVWTRESDRPERRGRLQVVGPNAVGRRTEKLVTTAAAAGFELDGSDRCGSPLGRRVPVMYAREVHCVEVRDGSTRNRQLDRNDVRLPSRLSAYTSLCLRRRVPARPCRSGQRPRSTSAIGAAERSAVAASPAAGRARRRAAEVAWAPGLPLVATIDPASTSVWSDDPHATGARVPFTPWNGSQAARAARRGPGRRAPERRRGVFENGCNGDRVGRRGRRARGGPSRSRRGRFRCDHRHDTARGEVVDRLDERVVGRSTCGRRPPEKLKPRPFRPERPPRRRPTISGVFRTYSERRRNREERGKFAEPRAGRHAEPGDGSGWSAPAGAVVPESPCGDAPTWRAVERNSFGSTPSRPGLSGVGPGKARATITIGDVHRRRAAQGKPGG